MSLNPDATSTPNIVPHVQGRKTFRQEDRDSIQSPITTDTRYRTRSGSRSYERCGSPANSSPKADRKRELSPNRSDFSDYDDEEDEQDDEYNNEYQPYNKERYSALGCCSENKNKGKSLKACLIVLGMLGLISGLYFAYGQETIVKRKFEDMCISQKKLFKNQDPDLCLNFEVALKEITDFDKTKTIILLYNNQSENVLYEILNEVTKSASCHIRYCDSSPVVIEGASLSVPEYTNDYGKILTDYKGNLDKNGLLILKNLEKVPGVSAQALHSFCDEYTPLVNKVLIILTLKVDKLPYKDQKQFVRKMLLQLWNDIGRDDKFDPLFSRIASTVLIVKSQ